MMLYLLRRFNLLAFTLLMLSLASYWLVFVFPGDPLTNMSGIIPSSEQEKVTLQAFYDLEKNNVMQFVRYLELLWDGNWGVSFASGQPLFEEIIFYLPASIELSAYALILSLIVGIPVGIFAGLKHGKFSDYSLLTASLVGYSVPVFWLALLLILIFSLQFSWFPISGRVSLLYEIPHQSGFIIYDILNSNMYNKQAALIDALSHLLLPTISISLVTTTVIIRITRRSIINVMTSDYIRAAYAKGLSNTQVFWKHGFRNALLPIMPQIAMQFTTLLTNAMIVETIFSWPGIGHWLMQAIYQQDYPAIRAGMLAVAGIVVLFNVCIDLIHSFTDPQRMNQNRAEI